MKSLQGKFTYANVVSTLCLFLLVAGGSAFAATQLKKNSVGTKQLKNGAVTAAKIKKGTITGAQLDTSSLGTVPNAGHAITAGSAGSATNATTATRATVADSANPEAFAFVEENGNVLDVRSKGIASANVRRPDAGVYCFSVPGFQPRGGQVTPEFHGNSAQSATITFGGTGNCPAPEIQVVTAKIEEAPGDIEPSNMPFYVLFYR